jgi:hypothetical protein
VASFEETRKVFRTFDGKVIAEVLVSGEHRGLEEFLAKLNVPTVKVYAVHDIIKFDHKIPDSALNKLI